jgi:hypothetical protein
LSFERSKRVVEAMELWFAEEQMDVLWHEDVAVEEELVAATKGFEGVEKDCAGVVVVEVGETVVTTEGEEVEMALGLVSLQTTRH